MSAEKPQFVNNSLDINKDPKLGKYLSTLRLPEPIIKNSPIDQAAARMEEKEQKERDAYQKRRMELLEKKRQERLKMAATPENAEKTWRESLYNVEKFCNAFGLKLLFNYCDGRQNGRVKGRALYIVDKEGKSHDVDNFNLDTHSLSRVKTIPRLRTEIANKLLITIGLKGLINLLDNDIKRKINREIDKIGITNLWKTAQRILNNPPLAPATTPQTVSTGTSVNTANQSISTPNATPAPSISPLETRILNLREKARNGDEQAADTLRRKCFKNYLDPIFGRKGVRFDAKGHYAAASLAELFPQKKVLWLKPANLLDSENKNAYIKLVRETDPITKKSEFYPVDDTDRELYCQYLDKNGQKLTTHMLVEQNDIIFIETPYPSHKEAIARFVKDPITNKSTRRLFASLDFENFKVKIVNVGGKMEVKTLSYLDILDKKIKFNLDFDASGLNKEKIIKKQLPEILTAMQFAKEKIEAINKRLGGGFKVEKMPINRDSDRKIILSKSIDGKKYLFQFILQDSTPQKLMATHIKRDNVEKPLDKNLSVKFDKLRSPKALQKFLTTLFK